MAGGLAGTALLLPGTAHADSAVATSTAITGTTQLLVDRGVPPVLQVKVSVTAQSGSQAPSGSVVVGTALPDNSQQSCTASLTGRSGATATGSCQLRNLPFGWYLLHAGFNGTSTFAGSSASGQWAAVGTGPKLTADSPAMSANPGSYYSYTFAASGTPAPTYHLSTDSPGWLHINETTGQVYGWIPSSAGSFSYSVIASNAIGKVTAGPFNVSAGSEQTSVVTKLSCPHVVNSRGWGSCTLTVTNNGPVTANGVRAGIALPWVLQGRSCYLGWVWSWGRGPGCWLHGNTASWHATRLSPGQSRQFVVIFRVRFPFANSAWSRATVTGDATWDNGGITYSYAKVFIHHNRWAW
jgi:hypothetical protein